ncbi:uncharacterized protein LOC109791566 [Cajanus cajan]|uniref:uncharacterized protein LOC109791566 n=1 Tax=Cajanus cajan TaxID=3821 RepID=UPI00098DA8E3|nr:uncharacterized protein LOC109791566 [Cajanus cajan]
MISTLIVVLCLIIGSVNHVIYGIQNTLKEDLELEKQLKLINKPPIKSIYTEFGDIVDCIDINKQPAFDHPLLKNHKLQRKPNFGKTSVKTSPARSIFGLDKDKCPLGTVPIRRTTKDDLIREKSLLNDHMIMTQKAPGIHVAEVSLKSRFGPYYGVNGTNSIYNPKLDRTDQITLSNLWVQNGQGDAGNKISVGWHVLPYLYGNDATHFYSTWTSDNYKKTGCYNIRCPGFVQTSKGYYPGARAPNTSTYGGIMIEVELSISQDPVTKNWWFQWNGINVGYFPAALFSNLASADQVGWGGRTRPPPGTPSPPMGSGHFPDYNIVHACYFTFVSYRDASGKNHGPEVNQIKTFTDNSDCYGVKYYGYIPKPNVGHVLQFGGPGGNCGN